MGHTPLGTRREYPDDDSSDDFQELLPLWPPGRGAFVWDEDG
jgi:hypothetical protein